MVNCPSLQRSIPRLPSNKYTLTHCHTKRNDKTRAIP